MVSGLQPPLITNEKKGKMFRKFSAVTLTTSTRNVISDYSLRSLNCSFRSRKEEFDGERFLLTFSTRPSYLPLLMSAIMMSLIKLDGLSVSSRVSGEVSVSIPTLLCSPSLTKVLNDVQFTKEDSLGHLADTPWRPITFQVHYL
jgi:hypothetical protein